MATKKIPEKTPKEEEHSLQEQWSKTSKNHPINIRVRRRPREGRTFGDPAVILIE